MWLVVGDCVSGKRVSGELLCFGQSPRYFRAWTSSPWVEIFIGLVSHGAWGCFDELNCLEESMLSAVSIQIQTMHPRLHLDQVAHHRTARQGGEL